MKKDRNFLMYFQDILESCTKIQEYVKNINKENFSTNEQIKDAAIRRFAIIGEAAKKLPIKVKNNHKELNWRKIIKMRNIFIHEYFGINAGKLWKSANEEIPEIKEKISKILDELKINKLI